jgi:ABC-type nitrate/sulfonate/bicarbonate transport system substrate-binding protein
MKGTNMVVFHKKYAVVLGIVLLLLVPTVFAQDEKPLLRFGASEDVGLEDIMALYVYEQLEEKGYEVEVVRFAETSFSIDALSNNDTDFATHSSRTVWSAVANGANIVTVLEDTGMDFVMVSIRRIKAIFT